MFCLDLQRNSFSLVWFLLTLGVGTPPQNEQLRSAFSPSARSAFGPKRWSAFCPVSNHAASWINEPSDCVPRIIYGTQQCQRSCHWQALALACLRMTCICSSCLSLRMFNNKLVWNNLLHIFSAKMPLILTRYEPQSGSAMPIGSTPVAKPCLSIKLETTKCLQVWYCIRCWKRYRYSTVFPAQPEWDTVIFGKLATEN